MNPANSSTSRGSQPRPTDGAAVSASLASDPVFDPELIPPVAPPASAPAAPDSAAPDSAAPLPAAPAPPTPVPAAPEAPGSEPQPRRRLPSWRFGLAMLLQLGLILPVPLRNAYVALAGETIVLDTIAVDPYDIFRGYSQTLAYRISDPDTFEQLPGYEVVEQLSTETEARAAEALAYEPPSFFVLLEAPSSLPDLSVERSPETWSPAGIVRDRPTSLPDNQIALRASYNGNAIVYNLERYYMPEGQRNDINQTVQELQQSEVGEVKVEVRVDRFGKAIPVGLWLGDRRYQF